MVSNKYKENEAVTISCSVNHTCASSPPSITWNKPDIQVIRNHEDLDRGIWRITSTFTFTPSYRDDKTQLQCTVTFPNMKISRQSVILDITYKPQNVTISVLQKTEDNTTLRCTSQANPAVTTYTWHKVGETKTFMGSGELITVQNGTSEKYICSAGNEIGTADSPEFYFMSHTAPENEKLNNILIIGGKTGFTLLGIILLGIFFILKGEKICCKMQKPESQENTELTYTSLQRGEVGGDYDTLQVGNSINSRPFHAGSDYVNA
ncbi:B-cell receptor CD22-like [Engystomops pustulosus]|uniref:B-cell receptor CD22-like n=1 Tax=Engystomops pustulosus TaxID=76066 RepID=UPI003AFA8391